MGLLFVNACVRHIKALGLDIAGVDVEKILTDAK